MVGDVAEVGVRLRELEACIQIKPVPSAIRPKPISQPKSLTRQRSSNLAHVLEVRPEVLTPGAGSCKCTVSTVSLSPRPT